jgi:hypothetical protein
MDEEMASQRKAGTRTLDELPPGRQALSARWVFAINRGHHETVDRYKTSLIMKGFENKPGQDYEEVYAPVHESTALRTILAYVAAEGLDLQN